MHHDTHTTNTDHDDAPILNERAAPPPAPARRGRGRMVALGVGALGVAGLAGSGRSLTRVEHAVCGLPAEELAKRQEWYMAKVRPLVRTVTREEGRVRFTLAGTAESAAALAARMAKLEEECCAFLTIRHRPDVAPTAIEVTGPDQYLDWAAAWDEEPPEAAGPERG